MHDAQTLIDRHPIEAIRPGNSSLLLALKLCSRPRINMQVHRQVPQTAHQSRASLRSNLRHRALETICEDCSSQLGPLPRALVLDSRPCRSALTSPRFLTVYFQPRHTHCTFWSSAKRDQRGSVAVKNDGVQARLVTDPQSRPQPVCSRRRESRQSTSQGTHVL